MCQIMYAVIRLWMMSLSSSRSSSVYFYLSWSMNTLCAISWYMSTTFFPPVGTDPMSPLSKPSAVHIIGCAIFNNAQECQRGASAWGWSNWTLVLENVCDLDEYSRNAYILSISLLSLGLSVLVLLVLFSLRGRLGLLRDFSLVFLLLFLGGCSLGNNKLCCKKSSRGSFAIAAFMTQ